jgi:catechol 2,3-dioxygenase-like lactoylglutathione lyase family enzyme
VVESFTACKPTRPQFQAMRIIRIDHVSLDVRDRARSLAWYEDVLGITPHSRHHLPHEPIFIGPDQGRLGLFAERPPGLRHIALATDEPDQAQLTSRLDRLEIPYRRERHRDSDSIYFSDPDGTTLEVMVPRR